MAAPMEKKGGATHPAPCAHLHTVSTKLLSTVEPLPTVRSNNICSREDRGPGYLPDALKAAASAAQPNARQAGP